MHKNSLIVLMAAALFLATSTPIMAAEPTIPSPAGALERVISFFDGMWKQIQESVCLTDCDRAAAQATGQVESDASQPSTAINPPNGIVAGADIFG